MSLDCLLIPKLSNLNQLLVKWTGDLTLLSIQRTILIFQDLLENTLILQLSMILEGLFTVERRLPIQITDHERVILKGEICHLDLLVKQIQDHRQVRFLKDKTLVSNQSFNNDLQCPNQAKAKNDQEDQHGKCHLPKGSRKK